MIDVPVARHVRGFDPGFHVMSHVFAMPALYRTDSVDSQGYLSRSGGGS
jgi:hypothetical protein